jgi:hypothetical protein
MEQGLTRDEDTALRCLAALADAGALSDEHDELMNDLSARDRRSVIRREGTKIPAQRTAAQTAAAQTTAAQTSAGQTAAAAD